MHRRCGVARWLVWVLLTMAFGRGDVAAQVYVPETGSSRTAASEDRVVRVGLGLGAGTVGSAGGGLAVRGAMSLLRKSDRSLTVRASRVEEFALFTSPTESVWDVGVLYGAQKKGRRGYLSASAGLALVGGMKRGAWIAPPETCWDLWCALGQAFSQRYEEEPFRTIGVPFEVEAGWTFSNWVGLALTGFGSLNPARSSIGCSLTFVVGHLR